MKYIVITGKDGQEHLLIFDMNIQHSDFASYFKGEGVVISAGFIGPCRKRCYGDSLSLNICSRPEKDTALLQEMFCL